MIVMRRYAPRAADPYFLTDSYRAGRSPVAVNRFDISLAKNHGASLDSSPLISKKGDTTVSLSLAEEHVDLFSLAARRRVHVVLLEVVESRTSARHGC
jgi:hypothetical protein